MHSFCLHSTRTIGSLLAGLLLLFVVACKPSLPGGILSEGDLEEVLYDYTLALSMADNAPIPEGMDREALRYQYAQKVFQKHGITEAEFDSTMVYYSSEGKRLQTVFQHVSDRLDSEAKALGVGLSESEIYASYTLDGDTANVWNGARIVYLSAHQPDNVLTITLPADSAYLPGDSYKLSFNANFLPSDGAHNAYAILSAYYADSSVVSQTQQIGGSYHCEINVKPKPSQDSLQLDRLVVTLYAPPARESADNTHFYLTFPSVLRIHHPKAPEAKETDDVPLPDDSEDKQEFQVAPEDTAVRRLTPIEERDNREERHDIKIVKERVTRPARPARVVRQR